MIFRKQETPYKNLMDCLSSTKTQDDPFQLSDGEQKKFFGSGESWCILSHSKLTNHISEGFIVLVQPYFRLNPKHSTWTCPQIRCPFLSTLTQGTGPNQTKQELLPG